MVISDSLRAQDSPLTASYSS